jgi:hypothetical protein
VLLVRAREADWSSAPEQLGWSRIFGRLLPMQWAEGAHYGLINDAMSPDAAQLIGNVVTS